VFDPGIDKVVEIEKEKVAHVVQKLIDLILGFNTLRNTLKLVRRGNIDY
jgi:hypothetical protein